MAWTQADVAALQVAIANLAKGEMVQRVRYSDGSEAEYRAASLPVMKEVLGMMQAEVNRMAGGPKRIRRILLNTCKGVD